MRLLETFENEAAAREFADYLLFFDIESKVEAGRTEGWNLWVIREEQLAEADRHLQESRQMQGGTEYQKRLQGGRSKRTKQKVEAVKDRFKEIRVRDRWRNAQPGMVTYLMIGVSVVVYLLSSQGNDRIFINYLTYFGYVLDGRKILGQVDPFSSLEVWRLFTPMFLHFGWWHIGFNMFGLYWLGRQIEDRQGWWFLTLQIVVMSAASNFGQSLMSPLPDVFGGFSGVLYGLFGYVWMQSRFNPSSGYYIDNTNVYIILGCYVFFFFGFFAIANTAHTVGLVIGLLWGYLPSGDLQRRIHKWKWEQKKK